MKCKNYECSKDASPGWNFCSKFCAPFGTFDGGNPYRVKKTKPKKVRTRPFGRKEKPIQPS